MLIALLVILAAAIVIVYMRVHSAQK